MSQQWKFQRTNGQFQAYDNQTQQIIRDALKRGDKIAMYEHNGTKYYIDFATGLQKHYPPGSGGCTRTTQPPDDWKLPDYASGSDNDDDDYVDPLKDKPGFKFVAGSGGDKYDIPFNSNKTILTLKSEIVNKIGYGSVADIKILTRDFKPVNYQTLGANGITDASELIIYHKDDEHIALRNLVREKKWEDKNFRIQAKKWLKDCNAEGIAGIQMLVTKNNLAPGWNDVLAKLHYTDILKIIRDENLMNTIDQVRINNDLRNKYGISDDEIKKLTLQQLNKMQQTTEALRDQFYENMRCAAMAGVTLTLDPDCKNILQLFDPNNNNITHSFFGVFLLIEPNELKQRGIVCKDVDKLKQGQCYLYPSFNHSKNIIWRNKKGQERVHPSLGGTGHSQLCNLAGLPPDFCGGFSIVSPNLKFNSGTCNPKHKVQGFENRTLNNKLQESLKVALSQTRAAQFYN